MAVASSCDDGLINEEYETSVDGQPARVQGTLSGADTWAEGYTLALAGFEPNSEYASIIRYISRSTSGDIDVVMSGIPASIASLELCVLNRIRQRIYTFAEVKREQFPTNADTIRFDFGRVRASMFEAIQGKVFTTTCANCHGASNRAAANLYLTEGRSYAALVGQPSHKVDGAHLVEPGDSAQSILHRALFTPLSREQQWHYDHTSEITDTRIQQMLDDWMEHGAQQ